MLSQLRADTSLRALDVFSESLAAVSAVSAAVLVQRLANNLNNLQPPLLARYAVWQSGWQHL